MMLITALIMSHTWTSLCVMASVNIWIVIGSVPFELGVVISKPSRNYVIYCVHVVTLARVMLRLLLCLFCGGWSVLFGIGICLGMVAACC